MYFVMLISRVLFLMFFGLESRVPGLENQAFCKRCIAKINFAEVGILMVPGSIFMISGGLGTNFHVDLGFFWHAWLASFWRPGGPWGDPWTLGSTSKDPWMSRFDFLLIFG